MSDLVTEHPIEHASSDRLHGIVTRYFSFVWRSLLRLGVPEGDAEDALQQVFIVASRRLEDITPGSEQAFLFSTTLHVAARARRTRSRRREVPDTDMEEPHDPAPAPDERLDRERARPAEPGEAATVFEVEVGQLGEDHVGRLLVESTRGRSVRSIDGPSCAEVVSGLALIAALTIDPGASLAASTRASKPAPKPDPTPAPSPPEHADTPSLLAAPPLPDRLDTLQRAPHSPSPRPAPTGFRWTVGLDGVAPVGIAPRVIMGAGPFVQMRAERPYGWALRLSAAYATSGAIDTGPSRASFAWGAGRLEGCPVTVRPASRLLIYPCVVAEGGFVRARGFTSAAIVEAREVKIPWLSLGTGLRVELEAMKDRLVIAALGGLDFPFVRQRFVFANPEMEIHAIPVVTGSFGLSVGIRIP
ncbi:RNA polymerase sigma factor RpoE [Minicystis rosea]|nr:RNA polymerase sigma factor RpoE [Minicystis rosea]